MRTQVVHRNGYTFRLPSFDHVSWRYAAAPDGTGTGWSTGVEDLDVDQPHGLTYRSLNHLAKAVRKRIEREHSTFGDATAGGEHIPGFCKVLKHVDTTADATTAYDATLFQYNGIVHSMGQKTLWCITGATGDPTILLLHPDKQFKGGDITWMGAAEFDQSADFTGPVHIDGAFLCDGTMTVLGLADFSQIGGGAVLDEDDMASDSASNLATQQSIKAYVLATPHAGGIVQIVNTQTGAVATGTTQMPLDDTIPQNTEGDEYMTLAITPKSATNKLKIEIVAHVMRSNTGTICGALFQDSTASAIAAGWSDTHDALYATRIVFTHYMAAGTTSATTFKFRAGPSGASTVTFNGNNGVRVFGGVMASSITITEIKV